MLKPRAPRGWSEDTGPREAPRAMARESMFWEIVPENVFEAPAKSMNAATEHEWRVKKKKNGNDDGSYLDRFGMESEIAAEKSVRSKGFLGDSCGRQTLSS